MSNYYVASLRRNIIFSKYSTMTFSTLYEVNHMNVCQVMTCKPRGERHPRLFMDRILHNVSQETPITHFIAFIIVHVGVFDVKGSTQHIHDDMLSLVFAKSFYFRNDTINYL